MTHKSSLSSNKDSRDNTPKPRMDWLAKDGPGPFIVALFVIDYERYVKNKAFAMRRWTEIVKNDNRL